MKKCIRISVFIIGLLPVTLVAQSPSLSEKMAATVMTIWKDSLSAEGRPAKWTYDQAVILKGIEGLWLRTGDAKYFSYMQKCMDFFVDDMGQIRTYKQQDYNIDNVLCGRILLTLFNVTGKEKYYKAATTLREQLRTQPRTNEGGFWHKKIYPYQMWLDGLYMGSPFYTEYAATFHEPSATFDDIGRQFIWMENHSRDAKTGLLFHGWDESRQQKWSDPQTGKSPHIWARAMGWYGMAMVDVLEHFPAKHGKRDSIVGILQRYAEAVKKVQQENGLWYDIIDRPGAKGNYFEASAACMFVYTMAKAVRLGVLPSSYLAVAKKGYEGIKKQFIETKENGQTNLNGTVSVSGLGGNPYRDGSYEYYISEKVIVNDPKGVGAFIQAANEMELVSTLGIGKGKTIVLDDYFNAERKKDITGTEKPWHYKWDEMSNGGFSLLGNLFHQHGVQTQTLSEAPTAENLRRADIYLLVDADNIADNPTPHYISPKDVTALHNWVRAGGVLVLFHNDKGNAEFTNFNTLAARFGIYFNEDSHNRVTGNDYSMGVVELPPGNTLLPRVKKIYQKEVSSITLKSPAVAALKKDNLVIFAVSKLGRGTVFATGDPWLYNEYTDGRKLPADYENFQAANDLIRWLLKQVPAKAANARQ